MREQSVRLDHPHIVSPYSWVAEDGTVLIASDLMTGGSLHTLIGDFGPLADEHGRPPSCGQVLSGLQAVHDAELIHRDVKPANLLLRATGDGPLHVVLDRFRADDQSLDARLTQVGMVIGTPGYVPPEVLQGRGATGSAARPLRGRPAGVDHDRRRGADRRYGGMDLEPSRMPTCGATVQALLRHDPEERPADAAAAAAMLHGNGQRRSRRTAA